MTQGPFRAYGRRVTLESLWVWLEADPRPETLRAYFRYAAPQRARALATAFMRAGRDARRTASAEVPGGLNRLHGGLALFRQYVAAVRSEFRRQQLEFDSYAAATGLYAHAEGGGHGGDPLSGWHPRFRVAEIMPLHRRAYEMGGQRALDTLRAEHRRRKAHRAQLTGIGEFAINSPALQQQVDQLLLDQIKGIDDTTADGIRGVLSGGGTISDMADGIAALFDHYSQVRGITIASTEMARASAAAELDTYGHNDVERVVFSGGPSGDECDEFLDEEYDLKDAADIIPVHPRCTHYWSPVLPEDWNMPDTLWAGGAFEAGDLNFADMGPDEMEQLVATLPGYGGMGSEVVGPAASGIADLDKWEAEALAKGAFNVEEGAAFDASGNLLGAASGTEKGVDVLAYMKPGSYVTHTHPDDLENTFLGHPRLSEADLLHAGTQGVKELRAVNHAGVVLLRAADGSNLDYDAVKAWMGAVQQAVDDAWEPGQTAEQFWGKVEQAREQLAPDYGLVYTGYSWPSTSSLATGQMRARAQVPPAPPSGIIAAFWLDPAAANLLAVPGQEAPDELHMTLAFLGTTDTLGSLEPLEAALAQAAAELPPVDGEVSGVGRFTPDLEQHAVYASVDAPALAAWRQRLVEILTAAGYPPDTTHGFTPHITLAYVPAGEASPVTSVPRLQLRFGELWLAAGPYRVAYPLTTGGSS